jgi:hypothetical protein
MQSFPKAAKGTQAGRDLRNSGDMWIACELCRPAPAEMAAKLRSNRKAGARLSNVPHKVPQRVVGGRPVDENA